MPVPGDGLEPCYNAQALVAVGSLLVVAADVVQAPNDKQQLEPMLGKIADPPRGDRSGDCDGARSASSIARGSFSRAAATAAGRHTA
jgi:hypothetical protein